MDKKPVIIVMAGGMGSRYGGLKQMDPVGPGGEAILDFSLFDARRAGFERAVLLISKRIESDFREVIGKRLESQMDVAYAFQELDQLPQGFSVPAGRGKPWGTGHAVLCCREAVGDAPFAVINADDYYGPQGFETLYRFLSGRETAREYAMVSYALKNTLTENGSVSRGVCEVDADGILSRITERTRIENRPAGPAYLEGDRFVGLSPETPVSMNFWGFTPDFMQALADGFKPFLKEALINNPEKGEYFLPFVVDGLIRERKAAVKVLPSRDKWYGVTYREDRPVVQKALARMVEEGLYPKR